MAFMVSKSMNVKLVNFMLENGLETVSYTHLTLPTKRIV